MFGGLVAAWKQSVIRSVARLTKWSKSDYDSGWWIEHRGMIGKVHQHAAADGAKRHVAQRHVGPARVRRWAWTVWHGYGGNP